MEIVKRWEYRELPCKLKKVELLPEDVRDRFPQNRGYHFCGYVQAPSTDFDNQDIEVHGGVTYGPDEDRWIGFDAGHWMDTPEGPNAENAIDEDWLTKETEHLVDEVLEKG